jgi:2-aminoadipate transaminase
MSESLVESRPQICLSQNARLAGQQAISFLMQQAVENADCLSLAAGLVDEQTLPVGLVSDSVSALLTDTPKGRGLLQYGTTPGPEQLRSVFRDYLHDLELPANADADIPLDRMVLTTGSQQLLQLITAAVVDPGDIVIVAAPTYFVFLGVVQAAGGRLFTVESDAGGMCPQSLQQTLQTISDQGELHRVKIVYVVSYFDNPSGISVKDDRKPQLLEIVQRFSRRQQILLLEDAAYRELYFGDECSRSIWSHDESGQTVALAQTFSKCFSPGVRVGLGVLPKWLVKPVCDLKGNQDFGSAHLNQSLVAHVIESGRFHAHASGVRQAYSAKSQAMVDAVAKEFAQLSDISWVTPKGGLYVWMTLPEGVDSGFDSELFRIATKQEKVMYVPGELSYPADMAGRPRNQMRLTFGYQSMDGVPEGIRRLARAVKQVID